MRVFASLVHLFKMVLTKTTVSCQEKYLTAIGKHFF